MYIKQLAVPDTQKAQNKHQLGTSLVVQWLRLLAPKAQVQSLVRKLDLTRHNSKTAKTRHNQLKECNLQNFFLKLAIIRSIKINLCYRKYHKIYIYNDQSLLNFSQFSCSVMSVCLRPHALQRARLPCPSPTPRVYSNSCPSSR